MCARAFFSFKNIYLKRYHYLVFYMTREMYGKQNSIRSLIILLQFGFFSLSFCFYFIYFFTIQFSSIPSFSSFFVFVFCRIHIEYHIISASYLNLYYVYCMLKIAYDSNALNLFLSDLLGSFLFVRSQYILFLCLLVICFVLFCFLLVQFKFIDV